MPVHNAEIADKFREVADLLEIEGANEFRVRAYRDAADTIAALPRSASDMVANGKDLTEMEGIGDDLAGKIAQIVETGELEQLTEIRTRTPPELAGLMDIEDLGPKRVKKLYEELNITTREELAEAAKQGRIGDLHGLGDKIEVGILEDLEKNGGADQRTTLVVAEEVIEPLLAYLQDDKAVNRVEAAGSYRRRKETVGDIDLVAASQEGKAVIERFVAYEDVEEIVSQGETRSTVKLRSGLQVDLRVVEEDSFGAALLYLTGSKAHNIELRNMALDRDWKINEYGVFEDGERLAGESEAGIYELFDLEFVPPELRENRGEIQAAEAGELPDLIEREDLRGDLQMHTTASDGHASLEEMASKAQELGHEYIAITDHSEHVGIVQGLDADELAEQIDQIDQLNEELDGLRVLKAVEVDILDDGDLALPDDILARLDLRVCSVHSKLGLSRDAQTERIIRAMDNPHFNILAHPTGRRLDGRDPMDLDMERVMSAALERGCYLELNAHPSRLDLNDVHCKMAKEMGLKVVISTDAHRPAELTYQRFGVNQARRGWLSREDVLNTRSWEDLAELLNR